MSLSKMGELLKKAGLTSTHSGGTTRHYLDTAYPPLNEVVSGDSLLGLPSGQIVMIAGPSACGKTMISTQLMISAQKQGGFAAFFDYERQYQLALAEKQGLDTNPDNDKFAYYKPETFEEGITDSFKLAMLIRENDLIPNDAPIVFVFDSLVAMTPASKLASIKESIKTGEKLSMHDNFALSAATNAWFPMVQQQFDKLGVTCIFLNQVRKKTDPRGIVTYTIPGGDQPYFISSTVLMLTATDIKDGIILLGKKVNCAVKKSRNTMPGQRCHWNFMFNPDGTGYFDIIGSYAEHLKDIGAIEVVGPRVKWEGGTPFFKQVLDKLYSDPEAKEKLSKLHKDFKS